MYKLREIERKDLDAISRWRNDSSLISFLGAPFRFINFEVETKWYENYMTNRDSAIRCAIVEQEKNEILGLISLTSIDPIHRSAELHIMIGNTKNQGKGIGTFAVTAMLQHGFSNLNLNRIELTVLESNLRAQHLDEKCGFVKEGFKRESNFKNGKYVGMYFYSILRKEYYQSKQETP